ncbi:hypothetical protein GF325_12630 [Candidatus Bathyarchaeota archaeon]|nr:hypothetical protein [Candidatus Bathyarchaeota archaeon]
MSKKDWLIYPKIHSKAQSDEIESALTDKAQELIDDKEKFKFFFLTGNYLGSFGFAYSTIRYWPGAIKPEGSKTRRSILDATFACLSVYLAGLVSYTSEYMFAYDEIKEILETNGRPDLVDIVDEKLPFVSMPPRQMLKEGQTPISPYYLIKSDQELTLGEIYPSVQLTEIAEKNIRSRYFCFFQHQGYSCFGFFDTLPENARFGFNTGPKEFNKEPTSDEIIKHINEEVETLKDLFVIFITVYNNSYLVQYEIENYETLLNKVLQFNMESETY